MGRLAGRRRIDPFREKFCKVLFFPVLFFAHLYLFPFEMCCHDCGRVCVSIFAPCVDSITAGTSSTQTKMVARQPSPFQYLLSPLSLRLESEWEL